MQNGRAVLEATHPSLQLGDVLGLERRLTDRGDGLQNLCTLLLRQREELIDEFVGT
jgi:hypothetical protein